MKRLFLVSIVALILVPGITLGGGTTFKEDVPIKAQITPVGGAYYNDSTWIFYGTPEWHNAQGYIYPTGDWTIKYVTIPLLVNDEIVKPSAAQEIPKNRIQTEQVSSCCVFQDRLYVFALSAPEWHAGESGWCVYTYHDARDTLRWSTRKVLKKTPTSNPMKINTSFPGMAAAVLHDSMYLFAVPDGRDYICYTHTGDGVNWSDWKELKVFNTRVKTKGNVAATSFVAWDGAEKLFVAWVGEKDNPQSGDEKNNIRSVYFDENGTYCYAEYKDGNKWAKGNSVAVIPGSVQGGPGGNVIQLFFHSDGGWCYGHFYRTEYYLDQEKPSTSPEKHGYCYEALNWPAALSNYRQEGGNVRKQVWLAYVNGFNGNLHVLRWNSDKLVPTEDISESLTSDTTFWTLMGVIEGPPPYPLNGDDWEVVSDRYGNRFGEIDFSYETSKTSSVSVETSQSMVFSMGSLGKPGSKKIIGKQTDIGRGLVTENGQSITKTVKLEQMILPVPDTGKFWVTHFYVVPTVRRVKYELHDYTGKNLGHYTYLFSVPVFDLVPVPLDMKDRLPYSPTLWDPATYMDRNVTVGPYVPRCQRLMTGDYRIGPQKLEITTEVGTESSQTHTKSKSTKIGTAGVFAIGMEGSVSFEQKVTTSSLSNIAVKINPPHPRSGYPDDIIRYQFRPYWLEPLDSTAYWIPAGFKNQRPWCVTYEVTLVERQGENTESVLEEELAACLNLDVAGLSGSFTINYSLPRTAPISIKIYDPSGRLVKTLASGDAAAGEHSISWDGSDDRGRALSSGVYFARLECGSEQKIEKIVMVR